MLRFLFQHLRLWLLLVDIGGIWIERGYEVRLKESGREDKGKAVTSFRSQDLSYWFVLLLGLERRNKVIGSIEGENGVE